MYVFDPYFKGDRVELKVGELVPDSVINKQHYFELAEYYKSIHSSDKDME